MRDAALGANNAFVYSLCNQHHIGPDVDLVMWEINGMAGLQGPIDHELALRNFFNPKMFPNRPSFVYPSGAFSSFSARIIHTL